MQKLLLRGINPIKGNKNILSVIIRMIVSTAAGVALYVILSLLGYSLFQPSIDRVTFRAATVIISFFGVLYGPVVGLFVGILGKAFSDVAAGWGFYWNASLAYGLMGFIAGFAAIKDFRSSSNILKAVLISGLGVLMGALFFAITEVYVGGMNLKTAVLNYFWPEFAGNLIVVGILLPLLIITFVAIDQKRNQ